MAGRLAAHPSQLFLFLPVYLQGMNAQAVQGGYDTQAGSRLVAGQLLRVKGIVK